MTDLHCHGGGVLSSRLYFNGGVLGPDSQAEVAKLTQGKSGTTGGVESVPRLLPLLLGWSPVGSGLRATEGMFVVSRSRPELGLV